MEFDLTSPCDDCPFRNDGKGIRWLGRARAVEIVGALERSTFSCHKTDSDPDDDDDSKDNVTTEHCAGALIMLEHMGKPGQMIRIAERLQLYDRRNMNMNSPVFKCGDEFVEHQARR